MVLNATSEYVMDYDLQLSAICMCRNTKSTPHFPKYAFEAAAKLLFLGIAAGLWIWSFTT
eukprot:scaffold451_cov198-Chaetoceros_neogracile.AAC.2